MNIDQQMTDYIEEVGVEVLIERDWNITKREGFLEGSRHYNITVSNGSGRYFKLVYSQGPAIKIEPSVCDVLYSSITDYSFCYSSFEDFCAELGYDEDSRKAYKMWEQLVAFGEEMSSVLSEDIIDNISTMLAGY